jgi:uncharacterized membrane protein
VNERQRLASEVTQVPRAKDVGEETFYQSKWHLRVSQVTGTTLSVLGLLFIIGGLATVAEGEATAMEVVIWSFWLPFGLWVFGRGRRMGVCVTQDGITVRNDYRDYHYRWVAIKSFSAEYCPPKLGSQLSTLWFT